MKKSLAVLVAAVLGAAALSILSSAPAAPSQSVSLKVVRTYDKLIRTYRLSFSGVISSGAAGQEVTVLQQTCGVSFSTAVAGAQTRDGGAWNAEPSSPALISISASFRARWGDVQSEPVTIRPPMPIFVLPIPKNRVEVMVSLGSVRQDMKGRIVLLQRLRNRMWTTVGRKPLVVGRAGGSGFSYVATFSVPRGWTVRGFVPATSAGPCFGANATKKQRT